MHVLVIPKGRYVSYDHFGAEASDAEIVDFTRAVARLCAELDLAPGDGGAGYRLIANTGRGTGCRRCRTCMCISSAAAALGRMLPG